MAPPRLPQLNIYKGKGALQLQLVLPELNVEQGSFPQEGCLMITVCPSTGSKDSRGNPTYNWKDDKIIMKLSDKDAADFLIGLRTGKASIIHDPQAGTTSKGGDKKFLNVEAGQIEGTTMIRMKFGTKQAIVPVDANEKLRLHLMIQAAIPVMYGWK